MLTLSNPLNLAVVGNPPRNRAMARRRVSAVHKKSLARKRALRYRWKKATRSGGKYSLLGATVRRRPGTRQHVKGFAWTGRKGTVALFDRKTGKLWGTNPGGAMINEAKSLVVTPVMALPKSVPALFKGSVMKNVLFASGGVVTGLVGGSIVQRTVMGALGNIGFVATAMQNDIVKRVVGASFALLTGGIVGRLAIKNPASQKAFVTGVAAAALVEAIFPGRLATYMASVPVLGPMVAAQASPVSGLAGMFGSNTLAAYVESPAYQGVGAYVESPAYQGVGAYVESPAYQGVGGMDDAVAVLGAGEMLAGNLEGMGSNMASHLDA